MRLVSVVSLLCLLSIGHPSDDGEGEFGAADPIPQRARGWELLRKALVKDGKRASLLIYTRNHVKFSFLLDYLQYHDKVNEDMMQQLRGISESDVVDDNACVSFDRIDEIDRDYRELYLREKLEWLLTSQWPILLGYNVQNVENLEEADEYPVSKEILRVAGLILDARKDARDKILSQAVVLVKNAGLLRLNNHFAALIRHLLDEKYPFLAESLQNQILDLQRSTSEKSLERFGTNFEQQIEEKVPDDDEETRQALISIQRDWNQRSIITFQAVKAKRDRGQTGESLREVHMWASAKTSLIPALKCLTDLQYTAPGMPLTTEMQLISSSLNFVASVNDVADLIQRLKEAVRELLIQRKEFLNKIWAGAISIVRIAKIATALKSAGAALKIVGGVLSIAGVTIALATAGAAAPAAGALLAAGTWVAVAGTASNVAGSIMNAGYQTYLNKTLLNLEIADSQRLDNIRQNFTHLADAVDMVSRQSRILKLQFERFELTEARKAKPDLAKMTVVNEFAEATELVMAKIGGEYEKNQIVSTSTTTVKEFLQTVLESKEKFKKLNELDEKWLGSEVKFTLLQTGAEIGLTSAVVSITAHVSTELAAGIVDNVLGGLLGVVHIVQAANDLRKSKKLIETAQKTRESLKEKYKLLKQQTKTFMNPESGLVRIFSVDVSDKDVFAETDSETGVVVLTPKLEEENLPGVEKILGRFNDLENAKKEFEDGLKQHDQDIVSFLQLVVTDKSVQEKLFSSEDGIYNPLYLAAVYLPDEYDSCAMMQKIKKIGGKNLNVNAYSPKLTTDQCQIKRLHETDFLRKAFKLARSVDTPVNAAITLNKPVLARCLLRLCADLSPPMRFHQSDSGSELIVVNDDRDTFEKYINLIQSKAPEMCKGVFGPEVWSTLQENARASAGEMCRSAPAA